MSRLKEYLTLLPKGLKNPGKVLEGIYNEVLLENNMLPIEEQNEIIRRRVICESCPFMNQNAKTSEEYFNMTGEHYTSKRRDKHCSSCGCPLSTKTASLTSDCGLTVLNSKFPEKAQELKWLKFKT